MLNFFSHGDNRHSNSLRYFRRSVHVSDELLENLTGQFHWTKMDLIQIFTTNHFRLFEALRIVFSLLFNRLTLGKTQPSAVDEFFRGRDGSEG